MKIAVDLDDVVLDFYGGIRNAVETEYDVVLPEFTDWHIADVLNPVIGHSWWKWMRERDWLWPNFPAVKGAIGGLSTLRREGHYLQIVTSKPEWAEFAVWKWLGKWRPPVNEVIIVGDGTPKWSVTDATLLVDDKPENCYEWAGQQDRRALLFDKPANRTAKTTAPYIVRVDGWDNVVTEIRSMS